MPPPSLPDKLNIFLRSDDHLPARADPEEPYNTPECGYDGGDCCECTCEDGLPYACGVKDDYHCRDPDYKDNEDGSCGKAEA